MCIAVCKPKGVKIAKRVLKSCFRNNQDGAGFAYACPEDGKVKIVKGLFTFRSFWENYREIDPENHATLIHFRIGTSGKINSHNCHPWRIDEKHAMVHNGVLSSSLKLTCENTSDTGLFVERVLKPVFKDSQDIWKTDAFEWLVEESIGCSNKIAIMDCNGEFKIFNEIMGEKEHGCWFSNKTYKEDRKKKSTTIVPTTNSTSKCSSPISNPYGPMPKAQQSSFLLRDIDRTEEPTPNIIDVGAMY